MNDVVVLRCGSAAVAGEWQALCQAANCDLLLSFYNETEYQSFASYSSSDTEQLHFHKGGKWSGIYHALCGEVTGHDFYFLPDDDLAISAESLIALFKTMREVKAEVAQPSLDHSSYFSHLITVHHPGIRLRKTNFVEVMAPCLSANTLKQMIMLFKQTESGFGLDYLWCMLSSTRDHSFIIDEIQIHHSRPIGVALQTAMREQGRKSPGEEWAALNSAFGISGKLVPLVAEVVLDSGRRITSRFLRVLALKNSLANSNPQRGLIEYAVDRKRYLKRQMLRARLEKVFTPEQVGYLSTKLGATMS